MRVFISWSGSLSHDIAQEFREWLPSTLQYVKPYFSPADIDKGARWSSELFRELSETTVCVIILTRESLTSDWIMFEAGAIAAKIDTARACPVVFDIAVTDLVGPLAQFQATKFSKEDMRKLLGTINTAAGEAALSEGILAKVFEKNWEELDEAVQLAFANAEIPKAKTQVRDQRDLLEEILVLVRKQSADRERLRAHLSDYELTYVRQILRTMNNLFGRANLDEDGLSKFKSDLRQLLFRVKLQTPLMTVLATGVIRDIETMLEQLEDVEEDDTISYADT